MSWVIVTEHLSKKWLGICSTCRKHLPVLTSFMTYHRVCTRVARRVPLVEHMSSPLVLSGVRVTRSLVLWVMFCRSLFDLFLLVIVLSVLRFTNFDYPFGIFLHNLLMLPSYQGRVVGILFTSFTPPHACTCPKPGLRFPTSFVVICVQWNKMRGDCSLCWYWWHCLPTMPNNIIKANNHLSP